MTAPAGFKDAKMLVFYLRDHGIVLATRTRGTQAADHLRQLAAENHGMIEVNFDGVEAASPPFLQELVREVRTLKDRAIYSCLNEDVSATLTFVENRLADRG